MLPQHSNMQRCDADERSTLLSNNWYGMSATNNTDKSPLWPHNYDIYWRSIGTGTTYIRPGNKSGLLERAQGQHVQSQRYNSAYQILMYSNTIIWTVFSYFTLLLATNYVWTQSKSTSEFNKHTSDITIHHSHLKSCHFIFDHKSYVSWSIFMIFFSVGNRNEYSRIKIQNVTSSLLCLHTTDKTKTTHEQPTTSWVCGSL